MLAVLTNLNKTPSFRESFQTVAEKKAQDVQKQKEAQKQQAAVRVGPEFQKVSTELEQELCLFSPEFYYKKYPSLIHGRSKPDAPLTPAEKNQLRGQYFSSGMEEGRSPCGDLMPHCQFQPTDYLDRYPDVHDMIRQGHAKDASDHYRNFGIHENRILCVQPKSYMDRMVWGCDTGDKEIDLSCPAGQHITRGVIEYGRWNNTICPSIDNKGRASKYGGILATTPYVRRTYPLPPRCVQANKCTLSKDLSADTGIDPVPNTYKHYQIRYRCDPIKK